MSSSWEFSPEMVAECVAEGLESLSTAPALLERLRNDITDTSAIDSLFRSFHSIKGNAGMFGLKAVSSFAHAAESALDLLRKRKCEPTPTRLDLVMEATDLLTGLLEDSQTQPVQELDAKSKEFLVRLEAGFSGTGAAITPATEPAAATGAAEVNSGAAAAAPSAPAEAQAGAPKEGDAAGAGPGRESLRIDMASMDIVTKIAGELFHLDAQLQYELHGEGETGVSQSTQSLRGISRELSGLADKLHGELLEICKVPVMQVTRPLERIVREVSRAQQKNIQLEVYGDHLRLDKQVLGVLRDPLVHIVRNSADHGIETPEVRVAAGKPERGTIVLEFREADEHIVVTARDDGKGINFEAVKAKAVKMGLMTQKEAEALEKDEIVNLIFRPGFSTAGAVSDISGRGVGLDVVMSNLHQCGGEVSVKTEPGQGSIFELHIPKLGSPVMEGLVIRCAETKYLLPLKQVRRLVEVDESQIVEVPGKGIVVSLAEGCFRLLHLGENLNGRDGSLRDKRLGVLFEDRDGNVAVLGVTEVLGRRSVLVEELSASLKRAPYVSGSFILGDGTLGFVLSVATLLEVGGDSDVKESSPSKGSRKIKTIA